MLNSDIETHLANAPEGFRRDWDAHIYFQPHQRPLAESLRDESLELARHTPIIVSHLIDRLVGPHPLPMFEINFAAADFSKIVFWLMHARRDLDVLVHQVTGDDPVDHAAGALWLGQTLKLDAGKLDPSPAAAGAARFNTKPKAEPAV